MRLKKCRAILIAVALTGATAGCGHRTCYPTHVSIEKIERSMQLPSGTAITAELDSKDDVQASKPGQFVNLPDGCYWLIETKQNAPFGQRKGVYVYDAENGREVGGGSTLMKIDKM